MRPQTVTAQKFVQLGQAQLHRLERARAEIIAARQTHDVKKVELARARETALDELTVACLPELTRAALDRVRAEAGYGRFAQDDPFVRMERRREHLHDRVRDIEADERYIRRAELLDPTTGELPLKLEQLTKDLDLMRAAIDRYENDQRFRELIRCGYDTETYDVSRWSLQYYRDWKSGDIFCDRFGKATFAEVREAYLNLQNGSVALRRDVEETRREIDEVTKLAEEHDESKRKVDTIVDDTLASCRAMLREHLEHIDRTDLARWMAADPTRVALLKRLHGIERKADYLDELAARHFGGEEANLSRSIEKLQRKVVKYQRPKHARDRIPAADASSWLADPTPKLDERRERFGRDYDRIEHFDRYDAFDYASDMLWWDLMTDGRIDGDFIPEVSAWHAEHPDWGSRPGLVRAGQAYQPPATDERDSELHEVS